MQASSHTPCAIGQMCKVRTVVDRRLESIVRSIAATDCAISVHSRNLLTGKLGRKQPLVDLPSASQHASVNWRPVKQGWKPHYSDYEAVIRWPCNTYIDTSWQTSNICLFGCSLWAKLRNWGSFGPAEYVCRNANMMITVHVAMDANPSCIKTACRCSLVCGLPRTFVLLFIMCAGWS